LPRSSRCSGSLVAGESRKGWDPLPTVGHNAAEFVLDFGPLYADAPAARTRIITGPTYAADPLTLLQKSLDEYCQAYGPIPQWT